MVGSMVVWPFTVEVTSETGLIREHIQKVGLIEVRDFIRAA